jgi:hypothetical protein
MIEDRYAAEGGVPRGIRGGPKASVGHQGRHRYPVSCISVSICRTSRRDGSIAAFGRENIARVIMRFFSVRRQPVAITSLANRKTYEKNQSSQTRGVGIEAEAPIQKIGSKCFSETLADTDGHQDRWLACHAPVV